MSHQAITPYVATGAAASAAIPHLVDAARQVYEHFSSQSSVPGGKRKRSPMPSASQETDVDTQSDVLGDSSDTVSPLFGREVASAGLQHASAHFRFIQPLHSLRQLE